MASLPSLIINAFFPGSQYSYQVLQYRYELVHARIVDAAVGSSVVAHKLVAHLMADLRACGLPCIAGLLI